MPIPPNEACVMPPLMNTIRRATMYEPIIPQATDDSKDAMNAFRKKPYEKSSNTVSVMAFVVVRMVVFVLLQHGMRHIAMGDDLQRAVVIGELLFSDDV